MKIDELREKFKKIDRDYDWYEWSSGYGSNMWWMVISKKGVYSIGSLAGDPIRRILTKEARDEIVEYLIKSKHIHKPSDIEKESSKLEEISDDILYDLGDSKYDDYFMTIKGCKVNKLYYFGEHNFDYIDGNEVDIFELATLSSWDSLDDKEILYWDKVLQFIAKGKDSVYKLTEDEVKELKPLSD